jgi:hypothetical protein
MAVAKLLNENPEFSKGAKIIIHTMNDLGQERMFALLKDRNPKVIPFDQLRHRLLGKMLNA